jgi:hypothetical protein
MKFLQVLAVALAICSVSMHSQANSKSTRKPASFWGPIELVSDPNVSPCESSGIIVATTTLFRKNKTGQVVFDKVQINQMASICGEEADFYGIIFGSPNQDCKIPKDLSKNEIYKGPCKSGWIRKGFFEIIAG